MGQDIVYAKLRNILGPERASVLIQSLLAQLCIDGLKSPDDRLRFADLLVDRGGVLASIGRSIKIQAILHGAKVIMVRGNFDNCLELAKGLAWEYPVALVNSVNPVRLEGQKTAAFEIVDRLGDAPDFHLLPVGNAGNISAYWLGYTQYKDLGRATKLPVMRGFQAEGAAPLVTGEPFPDPETKATAIRIGVVSWNVVVPPQASAAARARQSVTLVVVM